MIETNGMQYMRITLKQWNDAGLSTDSYKNDRKRGKLIATRATRNHPVMIEVESIKDEAKKAKIIASIGDPHQLPAIPENEPSEILTVQDLPEKLRDKARAMWDILIELDDFVAEKPDSEKVDSARERFVDFYNKGFVCTQVDRKIIGEITNKTLYGWQLKLKNNDNNPYFLVKERETKVNLALSADHKKQLEVLFCHPNRLNYAECHRQANRIWKTKGIQEMPYDPCYTHLSWFYKQNKRMCDSIRYGFKYAKDKYGHYNDLDPEKCVFMDQLVGDGHRFNFQIEHPDKPGKLCRATLVVFADQRTRAWMGYTIVIDENTLSVKLALYRALINYGRFAGLSTPALPRVIKIDNGRAFKNKELNGEYNALEGELAGLFARMRNYGLERVSYSIPYNARSKMIERMFPELNEFEKMWATYVGNQLINKPGYLQRNEKYLRSQHAALIEAQGGIPTLDDLYEFVDAWMLEYNNRPGNGKYLSGKSPFQLIEDHRTAIDYRTRAIPQKELLELMMHKEYKPIGKRGVTINKIDYYHEDLWRYTNADSQDRYPVLIDDYDKSRCFLFKLDGSFWLELTPTRGTGISPIISVNGTEQDREELNEGMKIQHRQEQNVKNQLAELFGTPVIRKKLEKNNDKALPSKQKALEAKNRPPQHGDEDEDGVWILCKKGTPEEELKYVRVTPGVKMLNN
jgi:hypothetical protein